jgi:hypothetical protein
VVTVDASFGTLHGSYWLCANLATRQPLLLVVNDAQWADETSLRFLGVLARRLDALRCSCCSRSAQGRRSRLAELAADPRTELLVRRPLSSAAVGALLGKWSPAGVDAEFALACEAATRGNPFLLSGLAHGLREHGIAFTAAHAGEVTGAGADAVRHAVAATLALVASGAVALVAAVGTRSPLAPSYVSRRPARLAPPLMAISRRACPGSVRGLRSLSARQPRAISAADRTPGSRG